MSDFFPFDEEDNKLTPPTHGFSVIDAGRCSPPFAIYFQILTFPLRCTSLKPMPTFLPVRSFSGGTNSPQRKRRSPPPTGMQESLLFVSDIFPFFEAWTTVLKFSICCFNLQPFFHFSPLIASNGNPCCYHLQYGVYQGSLFLWIHPPPPPSPPKSSHYPRLVQCSSESATGSFPFAPPYSVKFFKWALVKIKT